MILINAHLVEWWNGMPDKKAVKTQEERDGIKWRIWCEVLQ